MVEPSYPVDAEKADIQFMGTAIELARKGRFTAAPNPCVGALLVRDEQIIGEGFHQKTGEPHAEINALRAVSNPNDLSGATAYVTLEPCSHFGRTPPCAEALVKSGISRVVIAMQDPNPLVSGRGIQILQAAGIEVKVGVLQQAAERLNAGFVKRMQHDCPRVRVKIASSLDGRTAMANGESQWITGTEARQDVQRLRAESCAVVTGIETILADDAQLNVRPEALLEADKALGAGTRQPYRVVLDSNGRLPLTSRLLTSCSESAPVIWMISENCDVQVENRRPGLTHLKVPKSDSGKGLDLESVFRHLSQAFQVNEVLIESGATLAGVCLASGLVDDLIHYQAPVILGSDAKPFAELKIEHLKNALRLQLLQCEQIGADLKSTYRVLKRSAPSLAQRSD